MIRLPKPPRQNIISPKKPFANVHYSLTVICALFVLSACNPTHQNEESNAITNNPEIISDIDFFDFELLNEEPVVMPEVLSQEVEVGEKEVISPEQTELPPTPPLIVVQEPTPQINIQSKGHCEIGTWSFSEQQFAFNNYANHLGVIDLALFEGINLNVFGNDIFVKDTTESGSNYLSQNAIDIMAANTSEQALMIRGDLPNADSVLRNQEDEIIQTSIDTATKMGSEEIQIDIEGVWNSGFDAALFHKFLNNSVKAFDKEGFRTSVALPGFISENVDIAQINNLVNQYGMKVYMMNYDYGHNAPWDDRRVALGIGDYQSTRNSVEYYANNIDDKSKLYSGLPIYATRVKNATSSSDISVEYIDDAMTALKIAKDNNIDILYDPLNGEARFEYGGYTYFVVDPQALDNKLDYVRTLHDEFGLLNASNGTLNTGIWSIGGSSWNSDSANYGAVIEKYCN